MFLQNLLIDSLLSEEFSEIRPLFEEVELRQGEIIHPLKEKIVAVYFPTTCLLSWINLTAMGESVEVGMVGNEGISDISLLLGENLPPCETQVQVSGKAFKLSSDDFLIALARSPTFQARVASFVHLQIVQLTQSALCNRFHSAEARLYRWLLTAQDRVKTSEFSLTREILSRVIGAGRPTVSIVAGTLQNAGLIRTHRGKITILNRQEMEGAACECYQIVKVALDRYLSKQIEP